MKLGHQFFLEIKIRFPFQDANCNRTHYYLIHVPFILQKENCAPQTKIFDVLCLFFLAMVKLCESIESSLFNNNFAKKVEGKLDYKICQTFTFATIFIPFQNLFSERERTENLF